MRRGLQFQAERLGFHAWSVELGCDGQDEEEAKLHLTDGTKRSDRFAVDVPMRSFQGGYYPLLIALYKHLGLTLQPAKYTFSFSTLPPRDVPGRRPRRQDVYFTYAGASGTSLPILPSKAWSSPISFFGTLLSLLSTGICFVVLVATAAASWHNLVPPSSSFRDVVEAIASILQHPLPFLHTPLGTSFRLFATDVLVPLFSSVGTMTMEDLWSTPAYTIFDYIHAGMGTSHYTLGDGQSARDVVRLLSDPVRAQGDDHVRLGTTIRSVTYVDDSILLAMDNDTLQVDKIVLATPASVARTFLKGFLPSLISHRADEATRVDKVVSALGDIQYCNTIVVTHRDHNVLPSTDIKEINLVVPPPTEDTADCPTPALSSRSSSRSSTPCPTPTLSAPYFAPTPGSTYTMATHLVRAPHDLVLQTTNPVVPIDSDKILGMARLERALPVSDPGTLTDLHARGPAKSVYIAGSYAYPGIPLLEGCVGSARRVVDEIFGLQGDTGGVDWDAGYGSVLGRLWRWRQVGRGGY